MTLKQVAINTAIVLGIVGLVLLVWEFREAVIIFIFSLALAAAARPYVETLSNHHIPRGIALVMVYLLAILFLGLLFWAVGSSFLRELQQLADGATLTYDQIWSTWPKGSDFQQMIVQQLPPPTDLYNFFSGDQQASVVNGLLGFTVSSVTFISQVAAVFILSIYWSIDRVHFERLWLSILPVGSRARARDVWREIEKDFGAYVRSEVLQSVLGGLLLGLGLWAMSIHYPTILAVFGALAWLIPWMGGLLVVLAVTVTGLSQGILSAALATAYAIAMLAVLEFVIEPRLIRKRQFSALLSIILIIALIGPFGLLGFLVAPPLAAAIELIFRYNLRARQQSDATQSEEHFSGLRERILAVRNAISETPDPVMPQTVNMLARLEDLTNRAEKEIRAQTAASRRRTRAGG